MDAKKGLKKEVNEAAKTCLKEVQGLEKKAQNKKDNLSKMGQLLEGKKAQIQTFEKEAKEIFEAGEDPSSVLNAKSEAQKEIEELEAFISTNEAAAEYREDIDRAYDDLGRVVRGAVLNSTAKADQRQALFDAMKNVVAIVDSWQDAVKEVYGGMNMSPPQEVLRLMAFDTDEIKKVADRVRAVATKPII